MCLIFFLVTFQPSTICLSKSVKLKVASLAVITLGGCSLELPALNHPCNGYSSPAHQPRRAPHSSFRAQRTCIKHSLKFLNKCECGGGLEGWSLIPSALRVLPNPIFLLITPLLMSGWLQSTPQRNHRGLRWAGCTHGLPLLWLVLVLCGPEERSSICFHPKMCAKSLWLVRIVPASWAVLCDDKTALLWS